MNRKEKFENLLLSKKGVMVDFMAAPKVERRLRQYYGAATEKELLDDVGSDFFYLPTRDISQNEGYFRCWKKQIDVTQQERICPFGIRWRRSAYDSKFAVDEAIEAPLKNAQTTQDILRHPFPTRDDFDFAPLVKEAEDNQNRVIIGGLWTGIMGDCYRMYGFERFLTDIALEPERIHALVDKMTEVYLELNDAYFNTLKGKMDVWFFGNDFGSQMGLLLGEEMWAEFFFENIKKLCGLAKSYGLHVMMHSCGGIKPLIPFLIKAGVEILDPIQVTARDMEPEGLIAEFGDQLIFHGAVDTQHLLPNGKPGEVTIECRRLMDLFKESGYIFAGSQILSADIPTENIAAMYHCAKQKTEEI
ncbi:MAG TPA: uroporphyrinogen decarboxylase family protein [Oscillospiraceae bacterium]|nr:uroporphyrinogen decarboxylase family protein [Oscillospiraceae bacterium]HPS35704.1 uroporphyrinogen decarboxylase family protein [Oscillospiraceae bacterium]